MFNVVAELKGTELPNEYVLLSAHLDSWHGATGATDNGTGTITMLEAMRILKETYPRPRRTILVGHWGGEEQGTIGSLAFGEDHPDVINGLQVAFNQDNGTWRVEILEGQGFLKAGGNLAKWVAQLPTEMTDSCQAAGAGRRRRTPAATTRRSSAAAPGVPPAVELCGVPPVHLAHQPRHVRQDRVRRPEEQRDDGGDARLRGVGGPGEDVRASCRRCRRCRTASAQAWPKCGTARRSFAHLRRRFNRPASGLGLPAGYVTVSESWRGTFLRSLWYYRGRPYEQVFPRPQGA